MYIQFVFVLLALHSCCCCFRPWPCYRCLQLYYHCVLLN